MRVAHESCDTTWVHCCVTVSPADFVVEEVDCRGDLVAVRDTNSVPAPPAAPARGTEQGQNAAGPPPSAAVHNKEKTYAGGGGANGADVAVSGDTASKGLPLSQAWLAGVVGADAVRRMAAFAQQCLQTCSKPTMGEATGSCSSHGEQSLVLQCHASFDGTQRDLRRHLHHCVQVRCSAAQQSTPPQHTACVRWVHLPWVGAWSCAFVRHTAALSRAADLGSNYPCIVAGHFKCQPVRVFGCPHNVAPCTGHAPGLVHRVTVAA